jgi:hypothetical protein
MKKSVLLSAALSLAAVLVAACGATPEPTEPPPTQTPWIVVVTATSGPDEVAVQKPTQTPWIIVATPTPKPAKPVVTGAAAEPTATAEPTEAGTEVTEPIQATSTPAPGALKYPPPALLDPPNDRPVSWQNTVLLEWSSVGELAEDEYYHIHLERRPVHEGQQWYGDYVYTKETSFLADQSFLQPFHQSPQHGKATVFWWVRVVRQTGEDEAGKPVGIDVGALSEERTLILDPGP